jgi:hypothetical protein
VAHGDVQTGFGGQGGEFGLPRPCAVTVGAARVGGDQQPAGLRVVARATGLPPAADRRDRDRERGGVVIAADVDQPVSAVTS